MVLIKKYTKDEAETGLFICSSVICTAGNMPVNVCYIKCHCIIESQYKIHLFSSTLADYGNNNHI